MCAPYQWHLRATLRYEVLKQRLGVASAPSHRYWCGAARFEFNSLYEYSAAQRPTWRCQSEKDVAPSKSSVALRHSEKVYNSSTREYKSNTREYILNTREDKSNNTREHKSIHTIVYTIVLFAILSEVARTRKMPLRQHMRLTPVVIWTVRSSYGDKS